MSTMGQDRIRTSIPPQRSEERIGSPESSGVETRASVATGGSAIEALVGVTTIVLAILGLSGTSPFYMLTISTILIGLAFLFEAGSMAARFTPSSGQVGGAAIAGSGLSAGFVAGAAGIVLGVLALIGMEPNILVPAAVLVFGGGMLVTSVSNANTAQSGPSMANWGEGVGELINQSTVSAAGAGVLLSVAVIVLGILALVGFVPATLSLVALLVLGCGALLMGTAFAARWMSALGR